MLAEFLQTWNDPHARHAMLVHAPIVLIALGALPIIALACTGFKNATLRAVCVVWLLLASLAAFLAANAGEGAEDTLRQTLTPAAEATLHTHEDLAELLWLAPLAPAALVALTAIKKRPVRLAAGALAIAASLAGAGWVSAAAHEGGKLVYVHAVGVPQPAAPGAPQAAPTRGTAHDDRD
jgi:uncharacterized membrane protein